jgi:HEPN domain-containing protein
LALEKLFKAFWIKESITDAPPFTHDLQKLSDELQLEITAEDYDFLSIINSWNIRGLYPDYTKRLYQNTTDKYLGSKLKKQGKLKTWLEEKILKQK